MLAGVSMSCLNVNSLNMSNASKEIQLRKVLGVVKLKSDIIFLSDVRISNRSLVSSKDDILNILLHNSECSYSGYFNSSSNKRGVGILVKKSLPFLAERELRGRDENHLLIKAQIKGKPVILGAIYGPNTLNVEFFRDLESDINSLGNIPVILAGDWNATFSNLGIDINPDCHNMRQVPNLRHTELISDMCNRLNLVEPFRALNPTLREYTYIPRAANHNNKSRIDFFLTSESIFRDIVSCNISANLLSNLFDHKPVTLKFCSGGNHHVRSIGISNKILKDPDTEIIVDLAVKEAYLIYQDLPRERKNALLLRIGNARNTLRTAGIDSAFYLQYRT
jgi:exonuclease III